MVTECGRLGVEGDGENKLTSTRVGERSDKNVMKLDCDGSGLYKCTKSMYLHPSAGEFYGI